MTGQNPLPALPDEDQQITLVSVCDGNISVLPARVLVTKAHIIALSLEAPSSEPQRWEEGQIVTLLYTRGEHIMRLRAELRERVADDRLTVEPLGEAKEGDRRDFRRADLDTRIWLKRSPTRDPAEARALQAQTHVPDDDPGFEVQTLNLSGSGASFLAAEPMEAEDLVDVRIALDMRPRRTVSMIARVVRVIRMGAGRPVIAVRFAEISEADQDAIIYSVFARHFATSGLGDALNDLELGSAKDEDDAEA
ncbi:MAG: PilZ domain-containing protein [Myxococcota bacterium]